MAGAAQLCKLMLQATRPASRRAASQTDGQPVRQTDRQLASRLGQLQFALASGGHDELFPRSMTATVQLLGQNVAQLEAVTSILIRTSCRLINKYSSRLVFQNISQFFT